KTRRINGRRLCWGDRDQPQRVACNHRIRIQAPVSALIFFAMKGFYKAAFQPAGAGDFPVPSSWPHLAHYK
ncbi:MAG TPA: hypothetical protein VG347_19680, partial [Verrucomicrobiae bacterium]|nr:hypothetical protein [Verrucomicrobiae bacterium]